MNFYKRVHGWWIPKQQTPLNVFNFHMHYKSHELYRVPHGWWTPNF